MKRLYIAIVLLIISAGVCTFEFLFVKESTDNYISRLETIEREFSQNNTEKALKLTDKIYSEWQKAAEPLDALLYHEYVDDISNNMSKLEVYICNNEATDFYTTCEEIKNQLRSLKNSEVPTFENIV